MVMNFAYGLAHWVFLQLIQQLLGSEVCAQILAPEKRPVVPGSTYLQSRPAYTQPMPDLHLLPQINAIKRWPMARLQDYHHTGEILRVVAETVSPHH